MKSLVTVAKLAVVALPIIVLGCASAPQESDDTTASADQIVGGTADRGHTYVVAVGDASGAFCTGTVISRRVVVTAGHCFGGITRVFFGSSAFRPTRAVNVVSEIRHPGYNDNTLAPDLTVLQLASDALVQPAPLLREPLKNTADFIGPSFTFVGYGLSNGRTQSGFGTKRVVQIPIAAVGPARVGGTAGTLDATQFYYRTPGKNTCNGDSGGPAFVVRKGVETHAGVTSFGDATCVADGVQQRTDLPAITSFIQPLIDRFEGGNACRSDGTCNESCNTGGQVMDPDCHVNHCAADGICARACTADPDCR